MSFSKSQGKKQEGGAIPHFKQQRLELTSILKLF